MNFFYFLSSVIFGYIFNRSLSRKGCIINKRLPNIKLKFLQISPNIKIHFRKHHLHIHHWLTYSVVLILTFYINAGFLDTIVSKGVLIGGIIQGFTFSDWKHLVVRRKY